MSVYFSVQLVQTFWSNTTANLSGKIASQDIVNSGFDLEVNLKPALQYTIVINDSNLYADNEILIFFVLLKVPTRVFTRIPHKNIPS